MEPSFLITYHCAYCAHVWSEPRVSVRQCASYETIWCARCGVLSPRKGELVRYVQDRPRFTDTMVVYHLLHGHLYEIAHVDWWAYGMMLLLRDVPGAFNVLSFCPMTFPRKSTITTHSEERSHDPTSSDL